MKNESVKKSLEKSKNVLEEKRKMVKQKILHKKDQQVYNNCYELRSRAIKMIHPHEEKTSVKIDVSPTTRPQEFMNE